MVRVIAPALRVHELHTQDLPNYVSSRRYTWITFVPLSMLAHFAKYSNCYLLLTALMMLIPDVTPLSPLSALGPLLFVLLVSEAREFLEEFLAFKRDRLVNSQLVSVLFSPTEGDEEGVTLRQKRWEQLRPGDMLVLEVDAEIPCDCVLLGEGSVYAKVDTSKLDGESALRAKRAAKVDWPRAAKVEVEEPVADLYKFGGCIETSEGERKILEVDNMVLRGSVVREVEGGEKIIGIAVYCGKETKVELNSEKKVSLKWTKMDQVIDTTVVILLVIQLLICMVFAFKRHTATEGHWYLHGGKSRVSKKMLENRNWPKAFLTFMILMATLIPASLWVAREVIRMVQAMRIESDKKIGIGCNSQSLHDDLGCITYVFTDKTGTLTTNRMQIAALGVKKIVRGNSTFQIFRSHASAPGVQSDLFSCILAPDASLVQAVKEAFFIHESPLKLLSDFFTESERLLFLNLCFNHTCTSERASCPDEAAIVSLVASLGLEFAADRRSLGKLEVLRMYEFTAERRLMTVVVGDASRVFVLVKGADSAVLPLSGSAEDRKNLRAVVDELSLQGLRVLVLGGRSMTRAEWEEAEKAGAEEGYVLRGVSLQGCVALQDGLQEEVEETLGILRQAKISVAMVTGDKKETAMGVALNCGLFSRGGAVFSASEEGCDFEVVRHGDEELGVVVEGGNALKKLLKEERKLCAILKRANGAIFCRVTPGEKARLVELMQRVGSERVLAIGDGGNDVSMLLKSDIGVGISKSLEGSQAANSADYTIRKFSDLRTLLFVHGTSCLKKFTIFNKLFLFKNFILTLCQLLFFKTSGFSGQTVFEDWYLLGFNSVFCLLPLMVAASSASPVSSFRGEAAEYFRGRSTSFSPTAILLLFLRGVCTGLVLFFGSCWSLTLRSNGHTNDFAYFSLLLYTQLILLVSILTLTNSKFSYPFLALLLLYNLGMYALFVFVYDRIVWSSEKWRLKGVALTIFADPNFWLTALLTLSFLTLAEHAHRVFRRPYSEVSITRLF